MYGVCKICGCTDNDACIHPDFGACFWLTPEHDLCSHCVELEGDASVERPADRKKFNNPNHGQNRITAPG